MSDKRHWTPTRTTGNGLPVFDEHTYPAWKKLCDKAPDMAELLIELVKQCDDDELVWSIADKAEQLLKEIGYE